MVFFATLTAFGLKASDVSPNLPQGRGNLGNWAGRRSSLYPDAGSAIEAMGLLHWLGDSGGGFGLWFLALGHVCDRRNGRWNVDLGDGGRWHNRQSKSKL